MLEPDAKISDNAASKSPSPTGESTGFRGFNRTGREDTAAEILRPQVDPAVRRRNVLLIGVVALLLIIVAGLAFSRSHLTFSNESRDGDKPFAPSSSGGETQ